MEDDVAIVCRSLGPIDDLRVGTLPRDPLSPGHLMVRVQAAAVNFPDRLIVEGRYQQKPPLPFAPGFEVAGTVVGDGDGPDTGRLGQRVMGLTAKGYGGFASHALVRADSAVTIPDDMGLVEAAAFFSAYGTAHHALVRRAALRADETLVILGAAGAVGLAAIRLGKMLGATVIAVAGGTDKTAVARRHGADHVIDHAAQDLRATLKSLTRDAGADVCLDLVGGDAFDTMSRLMAWDGRLVTVGYASGRIPDLPANLPMLKGYSLVGAYWWPSTLRDPARHQADFAALLRHWQTGALKAEVHRVLPLSDAVKAIHALGTRNVIGKQVLVPDAIWKEAR